jgi:hypothetical protein
MNISKSTIKKQFKLAEVKLNFCWQVLIDLKSQNISSPDYQTRFLTFQETLAQCIFDLHRVREIIITAENTYQSKRSTYNLKWFKLKMKSLKNYKDGIDYVVNIAKSLGDAFVYFFYFFNLTLLEKNYSHERIINSTAGIGEIGELEFIKKYKFYQNNFIIYHGITNTLRYGDLSFVDLTTLKVVSIGELKTKKTGEDTIQLNLTILSPKKTKIQSSKNAIENAKTTANRREKQLLSIAEFLLHSQKIDDKKLSIESDFYFKELDELFKKAKPFEIKTIQASPGLIFSGIKTKKASLFKKVFNHSLKELLRKDVIELTDQVSKILKPTSQINCVILEQLLYSKGFEGRETPGTLPIFWYPLNQNLLRKLYFCEFFVMSLFNPAHIIEAAEELGFVVESRYSKHKVDTTDIKQNTIFGFDYFISYIVHYLQHESYILKCLEETKHIAKNENINRMFIKPQQLIKIFGEPRL